MKVNYEDLWLDAKAMTMSKARKTGNARGSEDGVERNSQKSVAMAPSDANAVALASKNRIMEIFGDLFCCVWIAEVFDFISLNLAMQIIVSLAALLLVHHMVTKHKKTGSALSKKSMENILANTMAGGKFKSKGFWPWRWHEQ